MSDASSQPSREAASSPWTQVVERLQAATVGEYQIARELGRGGMAAVFLAHEIALNRRVAIKVMSPTLLTTEGMVERFRNEAITVAQLSHPHIVTIYAVRHVDDLHFFVMKFVAGRSLEQVLRHAGRAVDGNEAGRLSIPVVRAILYQVGSALAYAHRHGVKAHRDVKPANILLDLEGNAVVTDFGIAKAMDMPGHTQTGAMIGTPAYMSPEQCLAAEPTWASDQYSLGIVAYQMLTGQTPFTGPSIVVMQAQVAQPVAPIRDVRPECPVELEEAVLRMLEKKPADRWPSMAQALAALGATPLAETDPVREELAVLATPDAETLAADRVSTPVSPIVQSRGSRNQASRQGSAADLASVAIAPVPEALEVGETITLGASVRNARGITLHHEVRWRSDHPEVARVDGSRGTLTGMAPGGATITASAAEARASVMIEVVPAAVDTLELSLPPELLHVGDRAQLIATPHDRRGAPLDYPVHWTSADAEIAEISPDGVLVGNAPGTVEITADAGGVLCSTTVSIAPALVAGVYVSPPPRAVPAGETCTLAATVLDPHDVPLVDRAVRWTSSDPSVATISAEGVVTAHAPGAAVITVECEGARASVTLEVVPPPVVAITIGARPDVITVGEAFRLEARTLDARRQLLEREVEWRSSDPRIASVSLKGLVTPHAAGEATITASAEGVSEAVRLVVRAPIEVVTITTAPPQALEVGETITLRASVRNRRGITLDREVTWASEDPSIAAVDPASGVVTGIAAGTTTITAAVAHARDVVTMSVVPAAVATVQLSARPHLLHVGDQAQLIATARDGRGAPLDHPVRWTSADAAVAAVSRDGMVTAKAAGTVAIMAEAGGASDVAYLSIVPAVVAAVHVPTPARGVPVGETCALAATVLDPRDTVLRDRIVLWSSSDRSIATVSPDGLLTAHTPGSVVITAECEGVRALVTVTITASTEDVSQSVGIVVRAPTMQVTGRSLTEGPAVQATRSRRRVRAGAAGIGIVAVIIAVVMIARHSSRPPSGLTLDPVHASLRVGDSLAIRPLRTGSASGALVRERLTWASTDPMVADVSPNGVVRGLRAGSAKVIASASVGSDTALVIVANTVVAPSGSRIGTRPESAGGKVPAGRRVTPGQPASAAIASLSITPSRSELEVGGRVQLRASVVDAHDRPLTSHRLAWRSGNPRVATVDRERGTVTGVAEGTTEITAASEEGTSAVTTVHVNRRVASVATVAVSPSSPLTVGETRALTVRVQDAAGTVLEGRAVAWASTKPNVASIDAASGVVTARDSGTVRITASVDGKVGSTLVMIRPQETRVAARGEPSRGSDSSTVGVRPSGARTGGTLGAADARAAAAAAAEQMRAGVGQCLDALRSRNAAMLGELYGSVSGVDAKNKAALLSLMGDRSANPTVQEGPIGTPQVGVTDGSVDVTVQVTRRTRFGAPRSGPVTFRAVFDKTGSVWRLTSCRILGTPGILY